MYGEDVLAERYHLEAMEGDQVPDEWPI